jgi:catechol 2,3-dioxygenase-like lactoylglutathione lyase family enzyme
MGLDLYMVGLQCRDLERTLEFYRRLGLAMPDIREDQTHVEIQVQTGVTLYFNAEGRAGVMDSPHVVLEFYLKERPTVDAKHAEMTSHGYQSYRSPFETDHGMYFAYLVDPDGNLVLLSAD